MARIKSFTIIYEDDSIIAVNKASGIAVTGERWDTEAPRLDLLLKQALNFRTEANTEPELYIVHRIDKETSGLVIFAKNSKVHRSLSEAFEKRRVEKTYIAVIHGRPSWPGGKASCDLPLVSDGNKKHLTIIDKFNGKSSQTDFTLLLSAGNYSVVEARPKTGRTHQIRVHLSALGFPIVCDLLYGRHARSGKETGVYLSSFKRDWRGDQIEERPLLDRLGLHAALLKINGDFNGDAGIGFGEERTAKFLSLEAPMPKDMASLINQMEKTAVLY